MDFKFAIRDYLTLKAHADLYPLEDVQVLVVSERLGQECEGGTQWHYQCRVIVPPAYRKPAEFSEQFAKLKEAELAPLDLEAYRKARSNTLEARVGRWANLVQTPQASDKQAG